MLALTQYNFIDGVSMTVVLVLLLAFLYIQYAFSYWKRRGIESLAGSFPLGNFGKLCRQKCTFGDLMMEFYRSSTQPIVGVYASMRPMLVVRDLELIRRVLNKDFHSFTNRGLVFNEKVDQLTINLFLMPYDDWRRMRTHVTPAFTPGKLKVMFSTLSDCALPLHQYLEQFVDRPQSVEMRDLSARYSTNVIASIAFGIEIDCITNKDDDFRKYGRIPFDLSFMNGFRHMMSLFAPKLMETLRIRTFDKKVADFMTAIVKQNLEYRETNNVIRKDFFQLLVQLRNNGKVGIDDDWSVNANKNKTLSIEEVAAQAFLFFAAGFETTSSVISFCLYELSKHPDVQDKLHADIDRVLAENDGELNYDTLGQMKYLDWCMDETMRMYPPFPILNRECTQNYQIPGTEWTIEKGTPLLIPVWALHHDEKYYPEPHEFRPQRFSDRKHILELSFLGFGDGPRACIGTRLGRLQTKIALVSLLRKYRFEFGDELLQVPMTISPGSFLTAPEHGINLRVKSR